MNTFAFVGKITPVRNTDTFKGFDEKTFDSGWKTKRLVFSVVSGNNRNLVEINTGAWADSSKNSSIFTWSKSENGKPGEKMEVPFGDRNNPDVINKVAGYRLFTIDTDTYSHRKEVEESGDDKAIEESYNKKHHFIWNDDFVESAKRLVYSDKISDMTFKVMGNIQYNYSESKDKYYARYEVTKIYRVDASDYRSEVNVNFFFNKDAFTSDKYVDGDKVIVNGWTPFYDSMTHKNWFAPISLVLRCGGDNGEKRFNGFKKIFTTFEESEVRNINLCCEAINGAEKVDITIDDLDDDTKNNIECGLITLDDAIKEAGGTMFGDKIQEIRISKLGRGSFSGAEDTMYSTNDCTAKPHNEAEKELDIFEFDDII